MKRKNPRPRKVKKPEPSEWDDFVRENLYFFGVGGAVLTLVAAAYLDLYIRSFLK